VLANYRTLLGVKRTVPAELGQIPAVGPKAKSKLAKPVEEKK
jgi:hypothetical protein